MPYANDFVIRQTVGTLCYFGPTRKAVFKRRKGRGREIVVDPWRCSVVNNVRLPSPFAAGGNVLRPFLVLFAFFPFFPFFFFLIFNCFYI